MGPMHTKCTFARVLGSVSMRLCVDRLEVHTLTQLYMCVVEAHASTNGRLYYVIAVTTSLAAFFDLLWPGLCDLISL